MEWSEGLHAPTGTRGFAGSPLLWEKMKSSRKRRACIFPQMFGYWPLGGQRPRGWDASEKREQKEEMGDQRPTFVVESTQQSHPGPWYACAMTTMCILRFREGPWSGTLDKNIISKIGRLVYEGQVEPSEQLCWVTQHGGKLRTLRFKGYDNWQHRLGGAGFFGLCLVCHRPFKTEELCWIHKEASSCRFVKP